MDQSSVFEIEGGSENNLMQNLSNAKFKDRQLNCVPDKGDSHGAPSRDVEHNPISKPQSKVHHPAKQKQASQPPPQNIAKSRKEKLQLELQKMESDLLARLNKI
jgi:hypothetical protein